MKGFLRSKRILTLVTIVMIAAAIVIPLSGSLVRSHAAAPQSTFPHAQLGRGRRISPSMSGRIAPTLHQSVKTVPQTDNSGASSPLPLIPKPARSGPPSPPVSRSGAVNLSLPANNSPLSTTSFLNFSGMNERNQSGSQEPADVSASVGSSNVVQVVNTEFTFSSRTGSKEYRTTFNKWDNYSGALTDPRVIYDFTGQRFIMEIQEDTSVGGILVSVAQQTDAQGSWCTYTFPTPSPWFPDQPKLGVDSNGIYIATDLYYQGIASNQLFDANIGEMESCQSATYYYWQGITTWDGYQASSIVPAVKQSSTSSEYLVSSYLDGGCTLNLWTLAGGILTNYGLSSNCYSIGSSGSTLLPSAQQKGTSYGLNPDDCRLTQAVYLNGSLDVALTGAYDWGNGQLVTVIWWFKIDPNASTPYVYQQGGFGKSGYWDYYPAMQQDSNGNAVIVYDISGSSLYTSADYLGLTANGSLERAKTLVAGNDYFIDKLNENPSRWGDYQTAALDPTNTTRIWVTGMAATSSFLYYKHYWKTSIGEVSA